jgi:hypothetical protein
MVELIARIEAKTAVVIFMGDSFLLDVNQRRPSPDRSPKFIELYARSSRALVRQFRPTYQHPRPPAGVCDSAPSRSGLPIDATLAHSCLDGHQISREHLRQFDTAFGGARGRGSEGS